MVILQKIEGLLRKVSASWGFSIAMLVLFNLAIFAQVTGFDYVAYDEPSGIHTNPHINSPFVASSVIKMFTSIDKSSNQYTPLSLLSFWLEKNLLGMDSGISHLFNLMLHLICLIAVLFLCRTLFSESHYALFAALFWSIHPMQVETVCWVLERRNLLYGAGLFSSLLFYARYLDTRKSSDFYVALFFMVFSGLAKTLAFQIPFLWLIIDVIKKQKLNARILREKWPAFLVSVFLLVILATGATGGMTKQTGMLLNVHKPAYALSLYMAKTLLPLNLLPILEINQSSSEMVGFGLYFFVLALAAVIIAARRSTEASMGFLFFIITILPLSGIVRVGLNFYGAYHFMYVPLFGLIFALFCLVDKHCVYARRFMATFFLLISLLLAAISFNTAGIWKNTETLYSYVLKHDSYSEFARRNLAVFFFHSGKLDNAIYHYEQLLQRYPHLVPDRYNLACILQKNGNKADAERHFIKLVNDAPDFDRALYGLGQILYERNDFLNADKWFSRAAQLNPKNPEYFFSRALTLIKQERFAEAELDLNRAIAINPRHVQAFWQRHFLLARRGDFQAAIKDIEYLRTLFSYDYSLVRRQISLFWQGAQPGSLIFALTEYCFAGMESEDAVIRSFLQNPKIQYEALPAVLPFWNQFLLWFK